MRRYLQGTLDFHCGIYAIINAISCLYSINLDQARHILAETILSFTQHTSLHEAFLRNQTDHYFVINYMLARWASGKKHKLTARQSFTPLWLQPEGTSPEDILANASMFLPEQPIGDEEETLRETLWHTLSMWLSDQPIRFLGRDNYTKCALLRFHRYFPGVDTPIVSHWTTAIRMEKDNLILHDASGEQNSVFNFFKEDLMPTDQGFVTLRIVPESIVLLHT